MPWRSSLIAGRMVITARASKATRVMVRTRPMVSPRRAGVISPAGRRDDRFIVGPRGHATGAGPALCRLDRQPAGLEGYARRRPPPNPPLGQRHGSGARASLAFAVLLLTALARFPREARQLAQRTGTTRLEGPPEACPGPGRFALAGQHQDGRPDRDPAAAGLGPAPGQRQAGRRTVAGSGPGRSGRAGARRRPADLAGQRRAGPPGPAGPERGPPPLDPGRRPVR